NGADALRVFIMFMGPIEATKPWSTAGLTGVSRFLERCWALGEKPLCEEAPEPVLLRLLHKTIKKVSRDTATLNYNTAISQMMIYSAEIAKLERMSRALIEPLALMLAPYAPHLAEELWERLGHAKSLAKESWPSYDEALCADETKEIVVQVNGKIRERFVAAAGSSESDLKATALELPKVREWTEGKTVTKIVAVRDKLVNIVAS
ncbi:MAG: class I tRNA ligase family protein, partial [Spirochaetaceae bacterium]|nr:class I tRNA ligase family protein [Spirochaetaceae bacterium]